MPTTDPLPRQEPFDTLSGEPDIRLVDEVAEEGLPSGPISVELPQTRTSPAPSAVSRSFDPADDEHSTQELQGPVLWRAHEELEMRRRGSGATRGWVLPAIAALVVGGFGLGLNLGRQWERQQSATLSPVPAIQPTPIPRPEPAPPPAPSPEAVVSEAPARQAPQPVPTAAAQPLRRPSLSPAARRSARARPTPRRRPVGPRRSVSTLRRRRSAPRRRLQVVNLPPPKRVRRRVSRSSYTRRTGMTERVDQVYTSWQRSRYGRR